MEKEEIKLFVFENDMIVYVENPQKNCKNYPRTFNK